MQVPAEQGRGRLWEGWSERSERKPSGDKLPPDETATGAAGGSAWTTKLPTEEPRGATELMRSKYCVRYELGMCPVHQGAGDSGSLFLINNGRRLPLRFDCSRCEMVVLQETLFD